MEIKIIGIIPCAGAGTRLGMGIKSLIKYHEKYLIEYPLINMMQLGITKVIIIHNGPDIQNIFGNKWNDIELIYVEQIERKGIAHAISLCENITKNENIIVILGDIIYFGDLNKMKNIFNNIDCLVGMKKITNKELIRDSYGVFGICNKFVEKPFKVNHLRPLLGLGIYIFSKEIYNAIRKTPSSSRGEIEITDTLNNFKDSNIILLDGFYKNINTQDDLEKI
jgi:dTDP-glucose pyrophosphorylase